MFIPMNIWKESINQLWSKHLKRRVLVQYCYDDYIKLIDESLSNGTYLFKFPRIVKIPKGNGDFRQIYVLDDEDRIVMHVLTNYYMKKYSHLIHKSSVAYSKGSNIPEIVSNVQKAYKDKSTGVKIDLSKFFDTVPIERINSLLDKINAPEPLKEFYNTDFVKQDSAIKQQYKSLCQGCSFSVFLANTILHDVDEYISKQSDFYCRYSDDIVMLGCKLDTLTEKLSDYGLAVNKTKTEFLTGQEFTFLGVLVSKEGLRISPKWKTNIKTLLKHSVKRVSTKCAVEHYLRKSIPRIYKALGGEHSVLKLWCDICISTDDIVWLDRMCKDIVRSHYTHKTNVTHNLHKVPNELFYQNGWCNLVHLYNLSKWDNKAFHTKLWILQHPNSLNPREVIETDLEFKDIWKYARFYNHGIFPHEKFENDKHYLITPQLISEYYRMLLSKIQTLTCDTYYIHYNNCIVFRDVLNRIQRTYNNEQGENQ